MVKKTSIKTANAAKRVTMSMDKRRVGSLGFSDNTIALERKKTPMAEASAITKVISLLRRVVNIVSC